MVNIAKMQKWYNIVQSVNRVQDVITRLKEPDDIPSSLPCMSQAHGEDSGHTFKQLENMPDTMQWKRECDTEAIDSSSLFLLLLTFKFMRFVTVTDFYR